MSAPLRRAAVPHGLAATLVLVSSFVHFVRSHDYSLVRPEILLVLFGMAGAGAVAGLVIALRPRILGPVLTAALVTWFIDVHLHIDLDSSLVVAGVTAMAVLAVVLGFVLRDHLDRIVSAVFATILVSTLLLGVSAPAAREPVSGAGPGAPDLPVVVHLILDEHIGLAGIPDDGGDWPAVKARLAAFYGANGFYVFPRAFSQYFESRDAISHALNLAETFDETLVERGQAPFAWRMTRNHYLAEMQRRGHRVQVYQPDFMDLCPEGELASAPCRTYRSASLKAIEGVALPTLAKLRITIGTYLISSRLYKRSRDHYASFRSGRLGRYMALPEWGWERTRSHPIAAMSAFERLREDLSEARRGDLFLAHLLLPHYPYVYDSACRIRSEPSDWLDRSLPEGSADFPNSAGSRTERYGLYLQQVECVTRKLDEILATLRERGLLEHAVVLVQGDHGSRITTLDPVASNRDRLTAENLTDSYSTLFALRAPGLGAGSDEHPWSLAELMRHVVTGDLRTVPSRPSGRPVADVYLMKGKADRIEPMRPEMFPSR